MHVIVFPLMRVCVWPAVWRHILQAPCGGGLENRAGELQIPILPLNMSGAKLQSQQNSRGSVFFCSIHLSLE